MDEVTQYSIEKRKSIRKDTLCFASLSAGFILLVVTLRPKIPGFISEVVQKAKLQQFPTPKTC